MADLRARIPLVSPMTRRGLRSRNTDAIVYRYHYIRSMPEPIKADKLVEVVNDIEANAVSASEKLQSIQEKLELGEKITAEDLDIVVTSINRIDVLARDRQDVGH